MADKTLTERLQPSLLDRLTDDEAWEKQEGRDGRVIDARRLRDIIRRDLAWLLNTTNAESENDMEIHPEVATSTVNFGVPDLAGKIESMSRALEVRQNIRRAVEAFEPRIVPGSLEISIVEEAVKERSIVTFDIRGELWAQPLPIELYLRTAMDVTTGEVKVERQG
ncbi:MAG: type VI secretion system baseplate subunit TssE [Pseudomonadota bacterium]